MTTPTVEVKAKLIECEEASFVLNFAKLTFFQRLGVIVAVLLKKGMKFKGPVCYSFEIKNMKLEVTPK